ncbi:hypothetical protein K3X13_14815 [Aliiroseovarius crassostreae]|uniref:hypothetical protein n=1 Tax=Aliiroseovarius crassostreae TaxID=154981 RepID=UPI002208B1C5|nr:hypothetical protein [Aliiroseovarius crassostreae]UWP92259.1 hypothetical protein K3X13_14815 [Aliiroseovarius crassostreae]
MSEVNLFSRLSGGPDVIEWFGRVPRFHDAQILDIELRLGTPSFLRLHAWNMTDRVGGNDYIVTEKHVVIKIEIDKVHGIHLSEFHVKGIVFGFEINGTLQRTELSWTSSFGTEGEIVGEGVSLSVSPGKPDYASC